MFGVLLKKQFREKFALFGKGRRSDVAGALLSTVLTASVIAVCVVVLMRLAEVYADVRMNGVRDTVARMSELLTVIYAAIFVLGVLSGIKNINFELFECEDRAVFMALPIVYSLVQSIKPMEEIFAYPPKFLLNACGNTKRPIIRLL